MTVHEFGKENDNAIILIHPSLVMWDYFEYVIPLLADTYHLYVPALPGYDKDNTGDFTSVEQIADELSGWLMNHGVYEIKCIYGCSMGGSIVTRMLADSKIRICSAVIDGGITPYPFPFIVTRMIAIRDFLMIYSGKAGGIKLLEKAFSTDEYSEEDLKYVAGVLKMISARTIWRTFESCNNYSMPGRINNACNSIEYWYSSSEKKARKRDINYIKKYFPQTCFREFDNVGHAGLATLHPEILTEGIAKLCEKTK